MLQFVAFLAGCAPHVVATRGGDYTLTAELRGAVSDSYALRDQAGNVVDRARPDGDELAFDLPRKNAAGAAGGRFYIDQERSGPDVTLAGDGTAGEAWVVDHAAWRRATACEAVLAKDPATLTASKIESTCGDVESWAKARDHAVAVIRAQGALTEAERAARRAYDTHVAAPVATLARAERTLADERSALRSSPAWRGGRCVLPATGAVPTRPWAACEPTQAKEWAAGICFATHLGAELTPSAVESAVESGAGRSLTAGESTFLELAVTPVAGAAAARARGQSYAWDDAAEDLLWTVADQLATAAVESDHWFWQLLGYGGKSVTTARKLAEGVACYEEVQDVCIDAYDAWQDDVAAVRSAPGTALASCETSAAAVPRLEASLPRLRSDLAAARAKAAPSYEAVERAEDRLTDALGALRASLSRPQSSRARRLATAGADEVKGEMTAADRARGAAADVGMDIEFAAEDLFDPSSRHQDAWNGVGAGIGWVHNDLQPAGWATELGGFPDQDGIAVEAYANFIPGRAVVGYHESWTPDGVHDGELVVAVDGEALSASGAEKLIVRRVTLGADLLPVAPFSKVISPYVGAAGAWQEVVVSAEFGDEAPAVAGARVGGWAPEFRAGVVVVAAPSWLLLDARGTLTPLPGDVLDASVLVTANLRLFGGD